MFLRKYQENLIIVHSINWHISYLGRIEIYIFLSNPNIYNIYVIVLPSLVRPYFEIDIDTQRMILPVFANS